MNEPPQYARLGNSVLRYRLKEQDYYKDAGCWSIKFTMKEGKVFAKSSYWQVEHFDGLEMKPSTESEWRKDNL